MTPKRIAKILSVTVCLQLALSTSYAQIPGIDMPGLTQASGAEFFVGRIEGKPLITVNLVGGVHMPGMYHIPIQTNISQLFAYAGGFTDYSEIDKIAIRSQKDAKYQVADYNYNQILHDKNQNMPILKENDTIFIPGENNLARTAIWVSIVSGVTAIILGGIAIKNSSK